MIRKACEKLIIEEGIELRILLSVLYSKKNLFTSEAVPFIIEHYNDYKRSFFQNKKRFYQIDSLYTDAYIFHRNRKIGKEKILKNYEQEPLLKYNHRVVKKYEKFQNDYRYYSYLVSWLQHPEKTEDEIIVAFLRGKGIVMDSLPTFQTLSSMQQSFTASASNFFDTGVQKSLTYYRVRAKEYEKQRQYIKSLDYIDSIAINFPNLYENDFEKARRLAMKQKMQAYYLHFLKMDRGKSVAISYYKDTVPTFGRSKEDATFAKNLLKNIDFSPLSGAQLPLINYDLLLLSNRYAELHNFGSNISYPKNTLGNFTENKGRKCNLYISYVEESFNSYPCAINFLLRDAEDWNNEINSNYGYINLHLLQYNANGQRVSDSVFELFNRVNTRLVKLGINDLEIYCWTQDYYHTAIKKLPSTYGWQMGKGNFDEKIIINTTTTENRNKKFLLPFEFIK